MNFSQDLLRAVAELEIRARRNVTALLAGNYRSVFRGSGMAFKEFRHYEPGDDIRHMSWTVTARTGRATIKTYEEERDLDVVLMVDVSGSSIFGNSKKRKIDMYAELTALIGLAAIHSGDNFGLLLFTNQPLIFLPPRRGRTQVMLALDHLLKQPLNGKASDLGPALNFIKKNLRHRSLVIVASDFLMPSFEREFIYTAKRHELLCLHCFDDAERGSAIEGVYEIWDPETGEFLLLDANSSRTRRALAEYQTQLQNNLEELCNRSKADWLSLSVEDDYLQRLVRYFKTR